MTANYTDSEVERELTRAEGVLRRANSFFLVNLIKLIDIAALREGRDEDDYLVDVPASRLPEVGLQIADLNYDVRHRFDADVNAMTFVIHG
ncbi:MAG: hypothetical protein JO036_12065 [Candidatus Eremiobacteraeota bacterium]|nr:hypothetical protein [Candidatus Eremiobacteraeota bacterium]